MSTCFNSPCAAGLVVYCIDSLNLCIAGNYKDEEGRREYYENTSQEDQGDDNRKRRSTDENTDTYDYFLNEYLKQNHEEDEESLRARRAYQESWEFVTRSAGNDEEYEDLKELIKKEYYSLSMEDRGEFDEEEDVKESKEDKTGDAFSFDNSVEGNISSDEGQQPNKTVPMELERQMEKIQHSDNDVAEVVEAHSVIESATSSDEVSQKSGEGVSEKLDGDHPTEEELQNGAFYDNLTMSKLNESHALKEEEEIPVNSDKKIQKHISEEIAIENGGIGVKETERTLKDGEENAGTNGNVSRTDVQVDEGHTKMHDDGLFQGQVSGEIANKAGGIIVKVTERTIANVELDGIHENMSRISIRESHATEHETNTQMHVGLIEEQIPAESVSETDNMFREETEEKGMLERQSGAPSHRDMGIERKSFVTTKKNSGLVNDTSTPEQHVEVNETKIDENAFKHGDSKTAVEKLNKVAYLHVKERDNDDDDDDDVLVLVEEDNSDNIGNDAFRDKDEASKADKAVDVDAKKVNDGRNDQGAHEQTENLGLHSMNDSQGKDNTNQRKNTVEQEGEEEKHSDGEIDDEEVLDFDDDPFDDDDDDDDDKSHFKYDVEAGRFKRAIWDNDDDEYEGDDSVGGMNEYAPDDEENDPHSIEKRSVDYDDYDKQFDDLIEEQKKKGKNEI